MIFLSVFSGIGGIDLGLERAGMTCAAQVEIEPFCRAVLAKHWPHVFRWSDVCDLPSELVRFVCGPIDLIAGGFACQDVSVAGQGKGIGRQTRSGLTWRNLFRLIRGIRPAWLLIENVPALRSRGADRVLRALERIGYALWPVVVGAEHVGAPHRRHRVWIVGRLADAIGSTGDVRSAIAQRETQGGTAAGGASDGQLGNTSIAAGERNAGGFSTAEKGIGGTRGVDGDFAERPEFAGAGGSGRIVADSNGDGQSQSQGQQCASGRRTGDGSKANNVAYAQGQHGGQRERLGKSKAADAGREPGAEGFGSPIVADSPRGGFRANRSAQRDAGHVDERGADELANADGARGEAGVSGPDKSGSEGIAKVIDDNCRRSQWPSRPGQPQHKWEASRLVEFPVGGTASGPSVRLVRAANRHALKALGNAVVWQIPYLIGRWIIQQHEMEMAVSA
ncbi:MAG: DNA cytosine methyltransferase [Phycisphaerae bacterium]|nr:DNA cytosine methyltransferase [Phycisphaerae bacterium]